MSKPAGCLGCLLFIIPLFMSCSQKIVNISTDNTVWLEGENFCYAPSNTERLVSPCSSGSKGLALDNSVFTYQDATVGYELELKTDLKAAKLIFRFARFHFERSMPPAPIRVQLQQGEKQLTKLAIFHGTGGWGDEPGQFSLLELALGSLNKGVWQVSLTSLIPRSNLTLDGFYLAPKELKLTNEELNTLGSINISNTGYYGLERDFPVIDQMASGEVKINARFFTPDKFLNLKKLLLESNHKISIQTKPAANAERTNTFVPINLLEGSNFPHAAFKIDFTQIPDGAYELGLAAEPFPASGPLAIFLTGELFNITDKLFVQAQKVNEKLKKSPRAAEQKFALDLQSCTDYLQTKKKKLTHIKNFWDFLAHKNDRGTKSPAQIVKNLQQITLQLENMLTLYKPGTEPYRPEAGLFLRAFHATNARTNLTYRVYIPQSYLKQEKSPCILLLHGGGGDEDYFTDLNDGEILPVLEKYGYVCIMPQWDISKSRAALYELVQAVRLDYPKIDNKQLFCSGISMGSFRALYMAFSYPGLFKALACVSGMVDAKQASWVNFPLLIIHGGSDIVVPLQDATDMAARLKTLKKPFTLHVFPEWGHSYQGKKYLTLTLEFFNQYRN